MPEFRFRRKNKQNRRKTVHDPEEMAKQIEAAKDLKPIKSEKRNSIAVVNPPPQEVGGASKKEKAPNERSSLVQEREKFFELLRSKYPEQASNLEMMANGEGAVMTNGHDPEILDPTVGFDMPPPIVKTTSASELTTYTEQEREEELPSTYNECLFLRFGKSVRHCPMPSPITLSTVKNLYRNLFDLGDDILAHPDCSIYIKQRGQREWRKLEGISMVADHCTLLLLEPGHTLNHTPSPPADSDINTPLTLSTHNTQESHGSQPHTIGESGVGSGNHRSAVDKETTPTITQGSKRNGLWRAGRSKDVEDLTRVPDSLPIHKTNSLTSPLSLTSSTSGVYSEPTMDTKKISERTHSLQSHVTSMKAEFKKLRRDHLSKLADFSMLMNQTTNQITAALRAFVKVGGVGRGGEEFRQERIELYSDKESYLRFSEDTLTELKLLETAVEEMRVDVVERRCGVEEQEVNALFHAVTMVTKAVNQLHAQYDPLEVKMKRVMESELKTVISEEKYLQEESPRVLNAVESCTKLGQTLGVLMQFASVQSHRTPLVPYYPTVTKPDREALLENIQAVIPNHAHRMECLERAEAISQKKKELHAPLKAKIKEFEAKLRIQRDHLKHVEVTILEKQQEMKARANFMEEKYKMEKEIERELETERKLAEEKREKRKKQMEELWKWKQRAKMEDERTRQKQSIRQVMEGAGNRSGSNRSIPSSVGSVQHTRSSSDDQTLAPHISLSQSNDPPPTQLTPASKGRRFRKKDTLQPWQRKSIGYNGEFNELYATIADEAKQNSPKEWANYPLVSTANTNQQSSNQSAAHKSQLTNKISGQPPNQHRSHDIPSNQIATLPVTKTTLGQKVETNDVTSNQRQQQFQTTPPFKHPGKQSSAARSTKREQIRTKPPKHPANRYLQYEHSSQPDSDSLNSFPSKTGYKGSINSLSQPSSDEPSLRSHMQPMLPITPPRRKGNTIGVPRTMASEERATKMKRSNSDDSIYESSTLERRKKQGLVNTPYKAKQHGDLSPSHNRRWAMDVLNKSTPPIEYRQVQFDGYHSNKGRVHARDSSASSGSSSERQGVKLVGQSTHRYPYPSRTRSDAHVPQQKHAPNCPAHGHLHNNPPIRLTRSAQVPTDSPLTSYPRHLASAAHTIQMRSVSNGMPAQQRGGRVTTNYSGHMISGGGHVTNRRSSKDDPSMHGSLV